MGCFLAQWGNTGLSSITAQWGNTGPSGITAQWWKYWPGGGILVPVVVYWSRWWYTGPVGVFYRKCQKCPEMP